MSSGVQIFGNIQLLIMLVLSVAVLAMTIFAFVDAVKQRADAFPATSNQTKNLWMILLGVSLALAIISIPGFGIFNMIAAVISAIYLTRVRPRLREITGGGPYGGW